MSAEPKDVAGIESDIEAEQRYVEASEGSHDGTCSGLGCIKCFLERVQPLLDAFEVGPWCERVAVALGETKP